MSGLLTEVPLHSVSRLLCQAIQANLKVKAPLQGQSALQVTIDLLIGPVTLNSPQ